MLLFLSSPLPRFLSNDTFLGQCAWIRALHRHWHILKVKRKGQSRGAFSALEHAKAEQGTETLIVRHLCETIAAKSSELLLLSLLRCTLRDDLGFAGECPDRVRRALCLFIVQTTKKSNRRKIENTNKKHSPIAIRMGRRKSGASLVVEETEWNHRAAFTRKVTTNSGGFLYFHS